jgi:TetR/AcrR family transcriptional regulator
MTSEHRHPGRPKATDAGRTRQLILNAAETEFATVGPAGARMDSIAERAGVTKALVHHYFENKDHLYEIVINRVLEQQRKTISELDLEKLPVEEALKTLLKLVYLDNVGVLNLAGLLIHESLQNGGRLYTKCGGTQFYWTLSTLIKRGIAEGHFKDVDPTHTAICIAGTFNYFYGIRENVALLFPGKDVNDKSLHEEHFNQAWSLSIASLLNEQV